MHHFCTYFDVNYLPRARVLHASLQAHCPSFHLHALCLDEASYARVEALKLPHVTAITLAEFEAAHPALEAAKASRSRLEYYFTCGPHLPLFVFARRADVDAVTYLDADLCFFADPQTLFDAWAGHSIGVTAHHLAPFRRESRVRRHTGYYNVGWLSFRRDHDGIACLEWWRDRCLEWCHERFEDGKYADQLYLDQWPKLFPGFYEHTHHGANVAPWNVRDYRLSVRDGWVYCDDDPLTFYHFHGLKQVSRHLYNTNLSLTYHPPHPVLKRYVYLPYILRLQACAGTADPTGSNRRYRAWSPLAQWSRDAFRAALGVVLRQYMYVRNDRIY